MAPGLLSREAWRSLEEADVVLARTLTDPQPRAILAAGIAVSAADGEVRALARELLDRAADAAVAWVGSPDGDPGLTDALAAEATRRDAPELEVLVGSWDQPGARLLDVVAVMDRLRSPGGCPWDAAQTHQSLVPYLIEEAHEAVEALESGDDGHIAEELGDVLLQVVFHARVAAEREDGFDIDDIAGRLVDKLVHRHPHVFADVEAADAAAVEANWEQLKATEKPHREHPLEGIPAGMSALARATKVATRLERAGLRAWLRAEVDGRLAVVGSDDGGHDGAGTVGVGPDGAGADGVIAARLMDVVLAARAAGVDPSSALRGLLRDLGATDPAAGSS
ncbi:MazG family protein [Ornithinimicrobium sp. F0845]|uniref:MazG family protein n=1 Tax=Ornithinimicrobium sp. F0845 TaxID=2926412 RepID=UPI001FF3627C|nr:MazG family protein [Ornithinimicrobium sp. F0845]MCK0113853.1 MazG family protein [Ornithinimicrobium sp. F0845]